MSLVGRLQPGAVPNEGGLSEVCKLAPTILFETGRIGYLRCIALPACAARSLFPLPLYELFPRDPSTPPPQLLIPALPTCATPDFYETPQAHSAGVMLVRCVLDKIIEEPNAKQPAQYSQSAQP